MIEDIIRLSNLCGVSGDEEFLIEDVRRFFEGTKYKVEIDNIGNVHVFKNCIKGRTNVLIFAHIDEIGFIVRKIDEDGFLRFERIGGVNRQIIPGCKVKIKTKDGLLDGVIGLKSHHFMPDEEKMVIKGLEHMYIDVFTNSKQETIDLGINVGSMVSFEPGVKVIRSKYIVGKSLDNRVAVASLYELARRLEDIDLNYNLHFAFPVMEEFNIRGLLPLVRKIRPEYSIGLDVTVACDTPDLNYNDISLGSGPAVTLMNFHGGGTLAGVLPSKELLNAIIKASADSGIPLQREVSPGVITENAFVLFENEGVKVANLSIPTRYTHTPIETVNLQDVEWLLSLLQVLLTGNLNIVLDRKGEEK